MPRSGRLRTYISEVAESPRAEKLSFLLPFIVIAVDVVLIEHAIRINEPYIITLTSLLFILSLIEIAVVLGEIHKHYSKTQFQQTLTIRLDDFILETKRKRNVKIIVEEFIDRYPNYMMHRNKIYHIAYEILETHKIEAWEKEIHEKLKKYIIKKKTVNQILSSFLKKYPKYKKFRSEIYVTICQIKAADNNNK